MRLILCGHVVCLLMVYNDWNTPSSWQWEIFPSVDWPHRRGAEVSGGCVWRHLQSQVSHRGLHSITHTQWRRKSQQRVRTRGPGSFWNQRWVLNLTFAVVVYQFPEDWGSFLRKCYRNTLNYIYPQNTSHCWSHKLYLNAFVSSKFSMGLCVKVILWSNNKDSVRKSTFIRT